MAAATVAVTHRPTVRAAPNAALVRTIVVDAHGRTLYRLSPETTRHLLCGRSCARTWPPLTVASRRTKLVPGPGVRGRLGVFRRPDGRLQVTLRGFPLYRFSGDRSKGAAKGNGRHTSGGTWEVLLPNAAKLPPHPPPAGPVTPPPPAPGPKLPPAPPPV